MRRTSSNSSTPPAEVYSSVEMLAKRYPATFDWPAAYQRWAKQSQAALLKTFYAAGCCTADTPIAEAPMVAMDFETTGLDPQRDQIVSIGIIPFTSARVRCREARHWLIKPTVSLAEQSVTIHGITHSELEAAPTIDDVMEPLLTAIAGKLVVVHFADIERQFLAQATQQLFGEAIRFPLIDTLALEHRRLLQQRRWYDSLLRRSLPSVRLAACRARYQLPAYQLHHALTDATATAELLQAQLAHHFSPQTPLSELCC